MIRIYFLLATLLIVASLADCRLVAIGDIHGDLAQYQAILQLALLTDKDNRWIGGNTTVVQVGDLLDRGPDDVEILQFSKLIQAEALAEGSQFVFLVGNHEIMNLQGAFHYVHPKSMEATGSKTERKERFAATGDLGEFIRTFKLVHDEFGTVFVHAGLGAEYARIGLDELNKISHSALAADDWTNPIFGSTGPVWTRTLINEASHGRCDMVTESLSILGLERMVVGHTPQRAGSLETYCDDTLIAIDVGMSKHMYGHLAALELTVNEGTVEMREISGKYIQDEDKATEASAASLEDALKDHNLLQEIMETVEETNKRNKVDTSTEREDL